MKKSLYAAVLAAALALPLTISSATANASHTSHTSHIASTSSGADTFRRADTRGSDCAAAKRRGRTCQITFGDGDDIEGSIIGPDGDAIASHVGALFGGLIRLRVDFRDKLMASLEDL